MIGRNPGSGVHYQEQSLHLQVRIPFTQRAVQIRLETPYGYMARMMRADEARLPAAQQRYLEEEARVTQEFWQGMRRDGVNVDTSGPHPEDAVVPPAHDRWQDAEHSAGYPGGGDRDHTPPGQAEMEADEPELG